MRFNNKLNTRFFKFKTFYFSEFSKCTLKKFKIGQILYIRYFYIHKKKRKMFKFFGLCVNKKSNYFLEISVIFNKEPIKLCFYIFNPFIINLHIVRTHANYFRVKR